MDALSDDDEDDTAGTQLLPTHHQHQPHKQPANKSIQLANVWDEREELFGVGEDSDDDEGSPSDPSLRRTDMPKITVTSS